MKKKILTLYLLVFIFSYSKIYSQCNNCGSQYPAATQSTTSATASTISTCMYGGDYAICNVTAGSTYNWQTCGSTSFDTQLTLQQGTGCTGTDLAYNDDGCGLQSSITWTATFTGTVSILVSQYNCVSNSICETLQWSCTSCGGGGGGSCPGAPTCSSSPPANDNCSTPTPICEFEGYCGNTSTAYTAASIPAGFCGSVENNSWLSFTASAVTATLNVYVCNCTYSDGIQMEIYSTNNCVAFSSFSNCWNPGIETNGTVTATGLTIGNTYLLMIDGFAGDDCDYTISAGSGVATATAIIAQTGTNTATICLGQSVNLSASGGTAYSWTPTTGLSNPNIANPVATPTATTVYTCNVTGGNPLCPGTATVSVTINVTPGLTITTSGVNPTCNGGVNGTATAATVTGGTTPYTYVWNDPAPAQTTQTATGLAAGTYTVTVTSANGCTNTATVTLTNPAAATLTLTPTAATCGSSNGTIAVSIAGGTANYNYSCPPAAASNNNPSNSYTFNALAAGTYNVTITTGAGCIVTGSSTIGSTGSVTSTFTYNGNQCAGSTPIIFTNTGTTGGGATFAWTFAGGTPATSTLVNGPVAGVTFATSGVHVVTLITTQGTCTSTTTINVTSYPIPVPNIITTNSNCNGVCNGVATANPTGGSAFSYAWSNGAITQAITGLCAGNYTVTVTNTDGCIGTQTVTITEPAVLNLVTTRTDATCFGLCNGTANVSVTPIGAYTYNWSGGSTPNAATTSSLCVGTYNVTVTSVPGCTQTGAVTVGQPADIVLTTSTTSASCGNPTGSATVNVTNGFPPITYNWNTVPAQTTQTATGLGSGAYTVTVTDFNGCIKITSANVSSSNGPTASIVSSVNIVCNGQSTGSAVASVSGGTAPLTYLWDSGTPPLNNTSISGLSAGIHTITVTDGVLCTATASVTITEPTALTATTSPVGANCGQATGSIQANPNGGTPPYTYSWNSIPVQTTQIANSLIPGTYSVTVTDIFLCTTTANGTISNLPGVNMAVKSTTDALCFGACNGTASLELTGGLPGYTFICSNGFTTTTASTNITITGLCAGSFTVTVTDGNSCQATSTFTIGQPAAVTASIASNTNVSCNGGNNGQATVAGNGGSAPYTGIWNTIPAQSGLTATGLAPGTYSVTISDFNNCTAITTVLISQPTAISLTTNKTNAHCGLADGTANVAATGGTITIDYTYLWSNGTAPLNLSNITGLSASGSPYTVTVTDNNGCSATANVIITDISSGTASISSFTNINCFGQTNGSATVSIGGGQAPFVYLWNTIPPQSTPTATGLGAGTYTANVTDANNCVVSASVTITEPAQISNAFTATQVTCFGLCNGQLVSSVSGGTSPYLYQWSNVQTTPSINNLCAGNYILTVIDANSCTQMFTSTISQPSQITITGIVTNAHCNQNDGNADINVSGGSGSYSYLWSNSITTQDIDSVASGSYNVVVTDQQTCTANSTFLVNNISGPSASITAYQNISCYGANDGFATVTATPSSGMPPIFTYIWNTIPTQFTASATNLGPGVYNVTITDTSGCTANTTITIIEPGDLSMQTFSQSPLCFGDCNGSAWVIPVGGTSPYAYQWVGGGSATSDSLNTDLCAGSYTIIVTDNNNCPEIQTVNVSQPAFISISMASTPLLCSDLCNGTASVTAMGGSNSFTYQWSANTNNQTTQQAVGLCTGTYSVTVTDNNNCIANGSTTVNSPAPIVISVIDLQHVKCFAQSDGRIILGVTGGVSPDFEWSNGALTQDLINIPYGSYCVTVSDNNGCSKDTCFIISQPPPLQVSTTAYDETCSGLCDGYIIPNVLGGQQPYTYLWSNFDTQIMADSLCPGPYSITVRDFNNCTTTVYDTVIGYDILDILIVNTDTATCGLANGAAQISVIGGAWTFFYNWPAGVNSISPNANNLYAGAYTVTVIDANNCIDSLQINISNATGPVIDSIVAQNVSCYGAQDGSLQVYYSSSTPGNNSFLWNSIPPQSDSIATNLGPGNYSVVITDGNNCITSSSKAITQPIVLQSAVTNYTNVSCFGSCNGSATAMANGGTQPWSFTWTGGGTTSTVSNLCAANYTVTVSDANNCISISTISISQPVSIQIAANVTNVTCNGVHNGQIILNVSGGTGYIYNWFPSVSTNSVASPLQPGDYIVIVSDFNDINCFATGNYTITEPNPIVITTDYSPTTCGLNNGLVYIVNPIQGGTPSYTYLWSPGNTYNDTVYNASAGTYTLQVTDANNCQANTNVVVSSKQAPTLQNISVTNISCPSYNDGSAVITTISGSLPYSYSWAPFTGNDSIIDNNNVEIFGLNAGIYQVTITDMDGCQLQTVFIISQPAPINIHADGSRWICNGQYTTISANASGGTLPYSFLWLGLSSTNQVQVVNPAVTTSYPVHVVDSRGCSSDTASVTIYVYPDIFVNLYADTVKVCKGSGTYLHALATGGNGGPYNYYWQDLADTVPLADREVFPLDTTTYLVYAVDNCGSPSHQDSVTIFVLPVPFVSIIANKLAGCEPLEVFFHNIDTATNVYFLWNFNDLGSSNNSTMDKNPSHTFLEDGIYNVSLQITTLDGCAETDIQTITVYPKPNANFNAWSVYDGAPFIASLFHPAIQFLDMSTETIVTREWDFGDNRTSGLAEPIHSYESPGTYHVWLDVRTDKGCKDSVVKDILIIDEFTLYVPTAFDPNSPINREFYPQGKGIDEKNYHLWIFDRWGEIMFETTDFNEHWNGKFLGKGDYVKSGSYVWYIWVKDTYGKAHEKTGPVTVIR